MPQDSRPSRRAALAFLVLLPLAAFSGALECGFVDFDDNIYVTENSAVRAGVTGGSLSRAVTSRLGDYWHPLTLLSHMADVEFFGLDPRGHHLTSLLLHALSGCLLFLILESRTGRWGPSAFVAAVFAVHPLQAESVVWVAGRKNVLSGFFWMLSLWIYVRDHRPGLGRTTALTASFLAAWLAKPVAVVLPAALLILDYWTLGRTAAPRRMRWLLALACAAAVFTLATSRVQGLESLPFSTRMANALVSAVAYLRKLLWPTGLSVFYPYPDPAWLGARAVPAALALAGIVGAAWAGRRRRPYLWAGALWTFAVLAPVLGIFQVGAHAMADRHMYLALIGPVFALAWLAAEKLPGAGAAGACAVAALTVVSAFQTRHWRDSEALFSHAVAVDGDNWLARNNLGHALLKKGSIAQAKEQFRKTLELRPALADAHAGLGFALALEGNTKGGIAELSEAVRLEPGHAAARRNLELLRVAKAAR